MTRAPRFRPTRAGIINLWDYRDQEFCFADGRLVLRGPNGSGKTKALEVLFPFVLDGRIEPRRLNPFAGEERTMKSNLLYRKQESAYSYVWMEFARGPRDDPEAVTVGVGMRATRSSDKVTRWYFVADGRVGIDFSLLGTDDRPLTRKQLADELGTDAIVDRPVEYRAAIDARLFGLGHQRYDQLITLILTLRRPQLAKNLDPKGLSQALTDGLRPLDEQLVADAARSFSDMEEVARALDGLVKADTAATTFVSVYADYLAVQARTDVDQVTRRLAAASSATTALFDARTTLARRRDERIAAEQRLDAADTAVDTATAEREVLLGSTAYEGKQQLDDLADAVRKLEVSTAQHAEKARKSQAALQLRSDEAQRARAAVVESAAALARTAHDLDATADECGIAWTPLPERIRPDQVTAAVRGHAEERDGNVRAVRKALADVDLALADRNRAEHTATEAHTQLEHAEAASVAAAAAVTIAREECGVALRQWWLDRANLFGDTGPALYAALDAGLADVGSDDAIPLREIYGNQVSDRLAATQREHQRAVLEAETATRRRAELVAQRDRIHAETDDAPPSFAARTDSRDDLTGAPFWRLVRFADDVAPDTAAGIEAALHGANILDGWVGHTELPESASSEQFLVPLALSQRPAGRTLAEYLVVEDGTDVARATVQALLESISVDDTSGAVRLDDEGRYRQGVQLGRHTKPEPEFIGATARERRRALRITELEREIEATATHISTAEARATDATARIREYADAAITLPRTTAVAAALRTVAGCAGALRTRGEAAAAADRDLDRAIAQLSTVEKRLRSTSLENRAPRTPRELDALAAAIRHFEQTGALLVRRRSEHHRETERARESDDRLAEARSLAEELAEESAIADATFEQQRTKLDTLRDTIGAAADLIDEQLEAARRRIEAAGAEQRAARKADRESGLAVGEAVGNHGKTVESVRSALTEMFADVARLAPYAHREILALLGAPTELSWPASEAAWSTVDQLIYRIEHATTPEDVGTVLPPEVDALYVALVAASAKAKNTDAARRSTRSALTTALQEFDAQLSASGHQFRLSWEALDTLTVVRIHDDQGQSSLADFADRIGRARADQELLLTDAERRILEDALLTGLAQQIHERTMDARDLIARMGAEMKQRRMSSGSTIGVHWVQADTLDDEARAVSRLLEHDPAGLDPAQLATIRAHFAGEIRAARAAHPERSYPEILTTTLDYRRWRVFSFTLIGGDGSEDRLTVARHSALSGGEQSVSLHLPLFAAAHVMLSSADPFAPRLLALDEAFAGVDDNGRGELLGLSVQFDLDLFMTGYDLWITYADVPGCAHYDLAHSTAENTVSAALLVWEDGQLLAEFDGTDLSAALGSPLRRRVRTPVVGGLDLE